MIAVTPREALTDVGIALHSRLYAPLTAKERRVADFGLLAVILDEELQLPDRLPRIKQETYEQERDRRGQAAPSSETLVRRYGSWKRACFAAWTVRIDGSRAAGWYGEFLAPVNHSTKAFTTDECVQAIHACASAIRRSPSSHDYLRWRGNLLRRARTSGADVRIPSVSRILKLLAPERGERDGWQLALAAAKRSQTR
jgi:hypothetical protein